MSLTDSKKKKVYSNVDLTRFVPSKKILKVADLPKTKMKDKIKVKEIKPEVKSGVVKFKNSDIPAGKFSYKKLLNKRNN